MHRTQIKATYPNCHARYSCWHSMSTKILSVVEIHRTILSIFAQLQQLLTSQYEEKILNCKLNWLFPVLSSFARVWVGLGSVGPLLTATPNSTVASRIGVWWWCDGHVRERYDSDKRPPHMLAQFVFVESTIVKPNKTLHFIRDAYNLHIPELWQRTLGCVRDVPDEMEPEELYTPL